MINRDEILELLDEALDRLPDELRQARWLLKEREEFLAKTRREADEILDAARAQAERMVQRTEVVRAAEQRARQIVEAAEDEARRLRHETEDFCDQRLAQLRDPARHAPSKTVQAGPGASSSAGARSPSRDAGREPRTTPSRAASSTRTS